MSINLDILRKAMADNLAEAKRILAQYEGKDLPAEAAQQVDAFMGRYDVAKAQYDQADRVNQGETFLGESEGVKGANLSWRESTPTEGNVEVDEKAWRELTVKTAAGEQVVRYFVPLAVEKAGKAYAHAFEAYLHAGKAGLSARDLKTLTEGTDSAGGFLVPADYQAELLKKIATNAVIRPLARKVTTSRDLVQFPRVTYTTDDKYTSGVRLTWTGESPAAATTARVTDPVFGLENIPVHTAMASMPVSNNLIEDSAFDIMGYSSDLLAEAFALGEDNVFINGTGVGQPMGLLTQVNGNGPAYVASGTSAKIATAADSNDAYRMAKLFYSVPSQYRAKASWVMNSLTMLEVENLVDGSDRPLIASLLAGGLAMGQQDSIKGRPVFIDEFVPDMAADAYPIIFGDLGGYMIVDRVGFSLQRLSELYAETNLTVLLARRRVGGYCTEPYRIKVMKCAAS